MAGRSTGLRVVLPTVLVAVVSAGLAVLVNLATEWKTNPWAWIGVVVLTLSAAGVSLWLFRSQEDGAGAGMHVERSVTGDVSGSSTVITGDGNQVQR